MIEPSGNICGGTSSYVPSGGGCGGGTEPSGNICGGTSSYVPSGGGCGCGGGSQNKFPGVRRVGTNLDDPRGRNFIPSPPATDKRREMLPNGGGVAQVIPTRTAEPVKAQGAAVPAMIPAATTKPTDLGGGPATNVTMAPIGKELVGWTAPDYCADDRIAATELCRQGGDEQLSDICRQELRAWIASGDKTPLAQWVASRELCSGELSRLLGLVNDVKASAGMWPVYEASGAPMSLIQPMRFANPSKPSFVPGMGMVRASSGMYRPSGVNGEDSMTFSEEEAADILSSDSADKGGKDFGTPAQREPSTTDYIRSIGGVATAALEGINRTIGQQADIRLRELMASNANAANVRSEANRQLQIELDAGIRRAQVAAQSAGSSERLAQLQTEIAAMREASTRSANLAVRNEPPSTPLVTSSTRTDEGLSTGAKVGIGVGAVAVLGLGAFLVMRKR